MIESPKIKKLFRERKYLPAQWYIYKSKFYTLLSSSVIERTSKGTTGVSLYLPLYTDKKDPSAKYVYINYNNNFPLIETHKVKNTF